MEGVTLMVLGISLVGVLLLALVSIGLHSARMERQAVGRMLPHEEEAYLLIKEVSHARR